MIFGLTANVCNYLSPQEKCMEDNACRNRAQACFAGFTLVNAQTYPMKRLRVGRFFVILFKAIVNWIVTKNIPIDLFILVV